MEPLESSPAQAAPTIPNGSGAAALLATGLGALSLALLSLTADKSPAIKDAMIFYAPTGPLSGVTTSAIGIWLLLWLLLDRLWRKREVALSRFAVLAFVLLLMSLLLTFPPLAHLL